MKTVPSGTTLICIKCGKELQPVYSDPDSNQPYGGTTFHTHGHYGSTVFDPMSNESLEINVCDSCLVKAAELDAVIHNTPVTARFWNGE